MKPEVFKFEGEEKYRRLIPGEPDTMGIKSGGVILRKGESVGEHSTGPKEEAIVVLEGEGEVICDGGIVLNAGKGAVIYVPPDTGHNVKNTGEGLLKYVYVVVPLT